jgi:phosphoribosylformimino-5-aminoimidazole carboxamide ribotide isomerase
MYIIPAIDLFKGACVRLIQGDYNRRITYRQDSVEQALEFAGDGAEWLHIVDLQGAKLGKPVNTDQIEKIAALGKLKIEVGGGLRDEDSIKHLFDIGVTRAIIGTKAVNDFEWFAKIAEKFPKQIALALDARGAKVATEAWTKENSHLLLDFAVRADNLPLAAVIYTDITKDGMMEGPNFDRTEELIKAVKLPVIASGGINSTDQIKKLAAIGAHAAIIGRSIYEGNLSLKDAIEAAK